MKRFKLAAVAVVMLCGIAGPLVAFAQDVELHQGQQSDTDASKVRIVIHQGTLLGLGDDALLSYSPETGVIVVQYADGQVVEGYVNPWPKTPMTSGTAWVYQESLVGLRGDLPKSGCASELAGLNTAIAAVQANCRAGGGQTPACTSAQSLLTHAFNDYNECVRGLIQAK